MAVIKALRNLSKMQFYKDALKIRDELTSWILHNFGAKYKVKELKIFAKQIDEIDKQRIYKILRKYDINDNKAFNLATPDWFYDNERRYLMNFMVDNIFKEWKMDTELDIKITNMQSEIWALMSKLDANTSDIGDWKVVKCYEAQLQGKEMPYDLDILMFERQQVRNKINELQKELEELEKEREKQFGIDNI